jgi:hypothetical protein
MVGAAGTGREVPKFICSTINEDPSAVSIFCQDEVVYTQFRKAEAPPKRSLQCVFYERNGGH